ncbi:hypothetical protein sync_2582 [Synechococcus sp. CC9311]|nr:hypothetical protein sync_2582 [Synechococcus sp. CC9311]
MPASSLVFVARRGWRFLSQKILFGLFLSRGIHSIVFSVTVLIKSIESLEYFLDDASRLVPQFLV